MSLTDVQGLIGNLPEWAQVLIICLIALLALVGGKKLCVTFSSTKSYKKTGNSTFSQTVRKSHTTIQGGTVNVGGIRYGDKPKTGRKEG